MMKNKKCVAMLLAGGQGSRLYALTSKIAKPAVPFGAKYRIIDFPMSNCINSNIDTVGVLTQYQPLVLNDYIGNGQPWDLDRSYGGVHILPPYQVKTGAQWYKGTANAIYQNMHFLRAYHPQYVLILSGDHIYKMDYSKMLDAHIETGAACTIAVLKVPLEEASRFGIMNADDSGKILEFEEKPKKPKSDLASMGIYIFTAEKLYEYLIADEKDPHSSKDFGKNIIPNMLTAGEYLYAYPFQGYWKDVGTIKSLWEANMDLLGEKPAFELNDPSWKIHSRNPIEPPHYIDEAAVIDDCLISGGCEIEGELKHSLLSSNVKVGKNTKIVDSIIMSNVTIGEGAEIYYSIVDENVKIGNGVRIGAPRESGGEITVVGRECALTDGKTVAAGEIIEQGE